MIIVMLFFLSVQNVHAVPESTGWGTGNNEKREECKAGEVKLEIPVDEDDATIGQNNSVNSNLQTNQNQTTISGLTQAGAAIETKAEILFNSGCSETEAACLLMSAAGGSNEAEAVVQALTEAGYDEAKITDFLSSAIAAQSTDPADTTQSTSVNNEESTPVYDNDFIKPEYAKEKKIRASDVAADIMDTFDANGDGALSASEIDWNVFTETIDANGDNVINAQEITSYMIEEQHKPTFTGVDEATIPADDIADDIFLQYDSNADGIISVDEIYWKGTGEQIDTNSDMQITQEELTYYIIANQEDSPEINNLRPEQGAYNNGGDMTNWVDAFFDPYDQVISEFINEFYADMQEQNKDISQMTNDDMMLELANWLNSSQNEDAASSMVTEDAPARTPGLVIDDPQGLYGICTESATLFTSLAGRMLMDQGMSSDESGDRVQWLLLGEHAHATLLYTADDGTQYIMDGFRSETDLYETYTGIDDFTSLSEGVNEGYIGNTIDLSQTVAFDWNGGTHIFDANNL